jgi:Flp pilus assembly protein protease CpaA
MNFGYWEITLAVLIPGILYASWIDYAQRRVPNWLNAALAAAGLAAQAVFLLIGGSVAVVMIVATGRMVHALANVQTIMTKMRRVETAFGEYGGARTFGATSQLLPYGVPLTAGTIAVLLTYYIGGWLSLSTAKGRSDAGAERRSRWPSLRRYC